MRKTITMFSALILTITSASALAATDEAKAANAAEKSASEGLEADQGIAALTLARQLANYGMAQQDPLALIVAARITRDTPTKPAEIDKVEGEVTDQPDKLGSVQHLLDQAKEYSGGRAEILALIDEVAKGEAARGALGGQQQHFDAVQAGAVDLYSINYQGGARAELAVIGEGGDIDCYVFDENEHEITKDTDNTSTCALAWTPRWTGEFKIAIKNYASRRVPYVMITN